MFHDPVNHAFIIVENNSSVAAVACVRKYLVVASTARGWWSCIISGKIANILISMPNQANNQ